MHEKVEIEPWSSCQPSWYTCAYACPLHAQPWNEHTMCSFRGWVCTLLPILKLAHSHTQDVSCSTCMRCYKTSSHMHYGSTQAPSMHPLIHPLALCQAGTFACPSHLMQHMHKMLQNEHLECLFHGSSHTHYSLSTDPHPSLALLQAGHSHTQDASHRHAQDATKQAPWVLICGSLHTHYSLSTGPSAHPLSIPWLSVELEHSHTQVTSAAHARDATKMSTLVLISWLLAYTLQLEHRLHPSPGSPSSWHAHAPRCLTQHVHKTLWNEHLECSFCGPHGFFLHVRAFSTDVSSPCNDVFLYACGHAYKKTSFCSLAIFSCWCQFVVCFLWLWFMFSVCVDRVVHRKHNIAVSSCYTQQKTWIRARENKQQTDTNKKKWPVSRMCLLYACPPCIQKDVIAWAAYISTECSHMQKEPWGATKWALKVLIFIVSCAHAVWGILGAWACQLEGEPGMMKVCARAVVCMRGAMKWALKVITFNFVASRACAAWGDLVCECSSSTESQGMDKGCALGPVLKL